MKQDIQSNAATVPSIRILKVGTCPSLSGASQLTYHIGCNADSEIHFSMYKNSSSGFFSKENIPLIAIQQIFAKVPVDGAITSYLLHSLFQGKSTNTPGFMLAALVAEGLVQPSTVKDRYYECCEAKAFFAEIQGLIESGVDIKVDDKPKKSASIMAEVPIKKFASKSGQKKAINPS